MEIRNRKKVKKTAIIFSAICVFLSALYLAYDLLWIPIHFKKISSDFQIEESSPVSSGEDIQPKYSDIKNKYPDFVGRIIIEDLNMNFPVAQCDNNSYYLTHTFDKVIDKHGALFVDYRNNIRDFDDNTVIYGHNMKDGTQFGMLNAYKSVENYVHCPVVTFNTVYGDYRFKVFSAFLINTKPEDDGGYVFNYTKTKFSCQNEFDDFCTEAKERSYIVTDADVKYGDKILTMSTCSTLFDNSRLVVMARLIRKNESENVDISKAYQNKDMRLPERFKDTK